MPLYEFKCQKCGEGFSVRTSITGRKNVKCPECESGEVKQKPGGMFFNFSNRGCDAPPRGGFS